MSHTKTIARTIFYQLLVLFAGISIGFITNADWVGWKYPIVTNSFYNTFFPVEFEDEGVLESLYKIGQFKICAFNNYPKDFKIIEEAMCAEEWYWCKYSYEDERGNTVEAIDHTRIRWKPWEYYYNNNIDPVSEEELKDYIENGDLNSRETGRAFKLLNEYKQKYMRRLSA
jgi:hypothetical protein